jgi:hypothetical protein
MARQRRRRKYSYINRRSKGAEMSDTEKALVKAYLEERDVLISYKQRAENAEAQLTALRENKFELEGKLASLADTIAAAHRNTNLPNAALREKCDTLLADNYSLRAELEKRK